MYEIKCEYCFTAYDAHESHLCKGKDDPCTHIWGGKDACHDCWDKLRNGRQKGEHKSCSLCGKDMNIKNQHHCYGNPSIEAHSLQGKPVCHSCWDDELERSVCIAETDINNSVPA